jgi:hypothetical protein
VVIPSGLSEVGAEMFSGTLCLLPAMVFGGGRVPASDPPVAASRFPPLGGGDAPVVLPIPLAAAAAVVVAVLDTTCVSQSETRVLDVTTNVDSRAKGDSPFYLCARVTGPQSSMCDLCPRLRHSFLLFTQSKTDRDHNLPTNRCNIVDAPK